jgi:dihydrolipoamide dehydrogenase
MEHYDVVVLGAGSAAEWLAGLREKTLAIIESGRVGGACPYVACIPSKAMLAAAHRRMIQEYLDAPDQSFIRAIARRDRVAEQRDDRAAAARLEQAGGALLRGVGRVVRPGVVSVDGREVAYDDLVIDTGSIAELPDIPGLAGVAPWSADDALSTSELPASLAILGGGAVGCELAQVYQAFGCQVTMIEPGDRLLSSEEPFVGQLLGERLREQGVDVRVNATAIAVALCGSDSVVDLDDGSTVGVERVLVAAGRTPLVRDLGLEVLGIDVTDQGLPIDDHCRVLGQDHIWAAGDVTGIAPYSHTANYHGRTILANLNGRDVTVDHRAIPRCVYTAPAVAAVGMTEVEAVSQGIDTVTAEASIGDTARALVDDDRRGHVKLVADRSTGALVGCAAIGARADDWIGEAILAVRARVPLEVLVDVVHPFPTISEVYEAPLRELAERARTP